MSAKKSMGAKIADKLKAAKKKSLTLELYDGDCMRYMQSIRDNAFEFTLASPPYFGKLRRYDGKSGELSLRDYVAWQAACIAEAVRVTNGYVAWVINDPVIRKQFVPATANLLAALHGGFPDVVVKRPVIWHKNAGSSAKDYFRNDYETVLVFTKAGAVRQCDWSQVASEPKWIFGGTYRQRNVVGARTAGGEYPAPAKANPGDVFRFTVGGGQMGFDREDDKLACSGFAPFPYKLAEHFGKVFSVPGDCVFDPFSGSGTTGVFCAKYGRHYFGCDIDKNANKVAERRFNRAIKYAELLPGE